MPTDTRAQAAKYYDLSPDTPADTPFYRKLIPSPQARLLELGCGIGRVLVSLAEWCGYIHGLDVSEAMVAICHRKLEAAGVAATKVHVKVKDITNFALNQTFNLIIAPYRVLQNFETDAAVTGLFRCIRQHLTPGGSCILNVFRPNGNAETLRREWCTEQEKLCWEVAVEGRRVTCHDRRSQMDPDKMVLYPELIYRRYHGKALVDEAVLKISMRCYYPEEFVQLVVEQGFRVLQQWGGYAGEPYGQDSELVLQFTLTGRRDRSQKVRRHGGQLLASCESTIGIFDAPMTCAQPPACTGAERDRPDAIIEVFEANICSAQTCETLPQ